ncbi:hypothetical protein [Amycolatopsis samaneae]|uniref:DUF4352 domain-containing protein n=1 Tax=Amycolatopsis samaneae TaxID=664691 RepID=A0ABW5GTK0_9PSEU
MIFVVVAAAVAVGRNAVPTTPAQNAAPPSMAPPPNSASPSPPSGASKSGFLPKKIGERAGLATPDDSEHMITFYITKITVDPKCTSSLSRPSGKHTILLDVSVQTENFSSPSDRSNVSAVLNPFAFQTRGSDGTTHTAKAGTCVPDLKAMPTEYAPNSKYVGQIELETEDKSGALLLAPGGLSNSSGWEWQY